MRTKVLENKSSLMTATSVLITAVVFVGATVVFAIAPPQVNYCHAPPGNPDNWDFFDSQPESSWNGHAGHPGDYLYLTGSPEEGLCKATVQGTQCTDQVDNTDPEDVLVDANDPGCHTDGDASNPNSYDPYDNDETDVPQGPVCGNDIVETPETCDGDAPQACQTQGGYSGTQSCSVDTCQWGDCVTTEYCGDEIVNGPEQCDGSASEGYTCTDQCTLEQLPFCGDGVVNQTPEQCDGTDGVTTGYYCSDVCTLQQIPPDTGIIIIKKLIGPNDTSRGFRFDVSWRDDQFASPDGPYDFDIEGGYPVPGETSSGPLPISENPYSIIERVPAGWTPTDVTCVSSIQDPETSDAIELDASETVTCTFTNSQDRFAVRGTKYEWPTEDGLSGWTIFIDENDNGQLDEGEDSRVTENGNYSFEGLTLGVYEVCEVQQQGYTQIVPADNGCHTVDFGDDESGVRNFHNDRNETPEPDTTRIIVRKVTNIDTTDEFPFLASWTENFTLTGNSEESFDLNPGTYSVAEGDNPSGWSHESTACTSSNGGSESNGEIDLEEGETVTCVTTNRHSTGGGGGGGGGGGSEPEPEVLGEQTEILPAAAPNTGVGAGGLDLMGSLSTLIGLVGLSFVNRKK